MFASRTNRLSLSFAVVTVITALIAPAAAQAEVRDLPNIVVLVSDDQGWNDIGYHNEEIRTPRLDELARRGVERLVDIAPWTPQTDVFVSIAAQNALDKLDGKAAFALDRMRSFPKKGGRSPNGRYDGYVVRLLEKTIADLEK